MIQVRLPAAGQTAAAENVLPTPRRESAVEGRILLVENEEAVLEFERDVLAGAGAEVVTCMGGEQLRSLLNQRPFDAVIMDGKMPGNDSVLEAISLDSGKSAGSRETLAGYFLQCGGARGARISAK